MPFDFNSLINNPMLSAGVGMLDPRGTYGSFGASLNKGLLAGSIAQQQGQQAAFMKMQMEAAQRRQEQEQAQQARIEQIRQKAPQIIGSPGGKELQGPTMPGQGGLLSQPSGLYAQNPQMAGLLADMWNVDPTGTGQAMLAQMMKEPKDPTAQIQNFQYLKSQGVPDEQAYQQAFGHMSINVGSAPAPLSVSDITNMRDRQGNQLPYGTTGPQAVGLGARVVQQPSAEEAKQMAQTDISSTMLDELESLMKGNAIDEDGNKLTVPEIGPTHGLYYQALTSKAGGLVPGELKPSEAKLLSLTTSLSNQLLAAMRGAQVGPAEQERFEQQLPMPGQPKPLFNQNLALTRQNLKMLQQRKLEYRNIMGGQVNRQPPPGFTVPVQ